MKLGFVYPDTGVASKTFTAARAGVDARLGLANAEGGVNGRHITYEWRDDEENPDTNGRVARDLVENARVFGLVMSTVAAAGSAKYLNEQGVPVTGLDAEPVWAQYRNMFSFVYSAESAIDTFGTYVRQSGGTKAVLLNQPLSGAVARFSEKIIRSMRAAGIEATALTYTDGVDDAAATGRRLAAERTDVLLSLVDPHSLAEILGSLRSAGAAPKSTLSFTGYDTSLLRQLGPVMAGVSIPLYFLPFEAGGPPLAEYRNAVRRYAPQLSSPDQEFALRSYIETDLFLRGLADAGPCPTRASFIRNLHNVSNYNARGLIAPISIRDDFGRQQTCYAFVRANAEATAFEVTQKQLCGRILPD
ncbi:ABC transporter substrate-binding protein [Frankia sp. AiPs1]|uniref:ABC transporter substrate-binding protein n=1 Tax=Frankia sp. AiPs1 TaxID=573493 RepID=UPI002043A51F|nr:ABC transporter substrate-binding protein [Frankia sp. AiPs1]MCM3922459.1 ABC transporter substrate-binding protein [Frankia sp. AiPs1]